MSRTRKRQVTPPVQAAPLPSVSICTITCNRAAFLPLLQACVASQTYPHGLIEWVIVDDSDNGEPPFAADPQLDIKVRHIQLDKRLMLGHKRNLSHEHCTGEIIVYMDDDDYYPPQRVQHAVERLLETKQLVAGATMLPIYFTDTGQAWLAGPYHNNHATANTFAFRRELLQQTRYEDSATHGEEKAFLKNYQIPMAQLDPTQTILCMGHSHNTFDKRRLIQGGNNPKMRKLSTIPNDFIQCEHLIRYLQTHQHTDYQLKSRQALAYSEQETAKKAYNATNGSSAFTPNRPTTLTRVQVEKAGRSSGTDKIAHHGYHRFYADFLSLFDGSQAILEIGLGSGESIMFWKRLFPNSKLFIADRDYEGELSECTILKCDQSSPEDLERLSQNLEDSEIGLILDDGSHIPEHQLATFNTLFPKVLVDSGIYIVEDIEVSYWRQGGCYGYTASYGWRRKSLISRFLKLADWVNREFLSADEKEKQLEELIDDGFSHEALKRISWICFAHNCIAIKKNIPGDMFYQQRTYRYANTATIATN